MFKYMAISMQRCVAIQTRYAADTAQVNLSCVWVWRCMFASSHFSYFFGKTDKNICM